MRVSKRRKSGAFVDLSPMLDVIFQLILFFLVSTTFASLPGISVNLPESSTSTGRDAGGITITLEENGTMWFNDEISSFKKLDMQLASFDLEGKKKETFPVTLSADDKVTNGNLVKVFDALRKNGFYSVSLRTRSVK